MVDGVRYGAGEPGAVGPEVDDGDAVVGREAEGHARAAASPAAVRPADDDVDAGGIVRVLPEDLMDVAHHELLRALAEVVPAGVSLRGDRPVGVVVPRDADGGIVRRALVVAVPGDPDLAVAGGVRGTGLEGAVGALCGSGAEEPARFGHRGADAAHLVEDLGRGLTGTDAGVAPARFRRRRAGGGQLAEPGVGVRGGAPGPLPHPCDDRGGLRLAGLGARSVELIGEAVVLLETLDDLRAVGGERAARPQPVVEGGAGVEGPAAAGVLEAGERSVAAALAVDPFCLVAGAGRCRGAAGAVDLRGLVDGFDGAALGIVGRAQVHGAQLAAEAVRAPARHLEDAAAGPVAGLSVERETGIGGEVSRHSAPRRSGRVPSGSFRAGVSGLDLA